MVDYVYTTHGTCSKKITLLIEDDIVINVEFSGGCNGNLQAVSKLVKGMAIPDIIEKLKGINCNGKGTSCPDQLALALMSYCAECKNSYTGKSDDLTAVGI